VPEKASSLHFKSHNVTVANEMVFMSEGNTPSNGEQLNPNDNEDYISAIVASAEAVLELRASAGHPKAFRAEPPRPDIILFAPAMYRHVYETKLMSNLTIKGADAAIRMLQRQKGYAIQAPASEMLPALKTPAGQFAIQMRGQELIIQSAAVGMRSASTVAATLRLPAAVNRVSGVVRQLATHLRANPDSRHKTRRVFASVQSTLAATVDPRLLKILQRSNTGIKIIGDALLEWLPVEGLPLGLRFDVSRINATPGGLSFGELVNQATLYLQPQDFEEVLILSAFDADDPIRDHLRTAVTRFDPTGKVRARVVEIHTVRDFIDALNSFQGAMVVFDGHGFHDEHSDVGFLKIGGENLDVWALRQSTRVPPIVILSACDTHALDRSHATTGNGFIFCGARAVLATILPVRSIHSAILIARLLYRAVEYSRAVTNYGIAVPWTHLVSGLFRMQITTDIRAPRTIAFLLRDR
jgi:hypothetical protein